MLLAELERLQPELMPVLRGRAADWCQRNGLAEEALEYAIAAGDLDTVAHLPQNLWTPTYRQGRFATVQRWFRWLDERGGMARHPAVAGQIALIAANTGRPAEAERWPAWPITGSTRTRRGLLILAPRHGRPWPG